VGKRTNKQIALVREASDAVEAILGHSLGEVSGLTDAEWNETVQLGAKVLFAKTINKGIMCLDAIDAEKLAKSSAVAAATAGAILIDKATDKLLPILNGGNGNSYNPSDIGNLLSRVEVTVRELRVSGATNDVPTFEAIEGGQVIDAPVGDIGPGSEESIAPGSTSEEGTNLRDTEGS